MKKDFCHTIKEFSFGEYRDKASRFLAYAKPVYSTGEFQSGLEELHKEHFKARHICYAYRIGFEGEEYRFNDDGEPAGTAGLPIYNQLLSFGYSFTGVAVVRYFGGTKLGTSGLIAAYKTASRLALENAKSKKIYDTTGFRLIFDYSIMGELMDHIKSMNVEIENQTFDEHPFVDIKIRTSKADQLIRKIKARILKVDWEAVGKETPAPHLSIQKLE